jgi:hypothetical protein
MSGTTFPADKRERTAMIEEMGDRGKAGVAAAAAQVKAEVEILESDPTPPSSPTGVEEKSTDTEAIGDIFTNYAHTGIDNPKTRERIEKRVKPFDLDRLFEDDHVTQHVPIVPGRCEAVFETITRKEEMEILRYAVKRAKALYEDEQFMHQTLIHDYDLAARLSAYNGQELPRVWVDEKLVPEALETRREHISTRPDFVHQMLSSNARWFIDRAQRVLANIDEHLGNA